MTGGSAHGDAALCPEDLRGDRRELAAEGQRQQAEDPPGRVQESLSHSLVEGLMDQTDPVNCPPLHCHDLEEFTHTQWKKVSLQLYNHTRGPNA